MTLRSVVYRIPSGSCADCYGPAGNLDECSVNVGSPSHDFLTGVELDPPSGYLRSVESNLRGLFHKVHSTKSVFGLPRNGCALGGKHSTKGQVDILWHGVGFARPAALAKHGDCRLGKRLEAA